MANFRARFDGHVLILENPLDLPQGSIVDVRAEVVESPEASALQELAKLAIQFPDSPDTPVDGAAQHDHYLYQTPKRP